MGWYELLDERQKVIMEPVDVGGFYEKFGMTIFNIM